MILRSPGMALSSGSARATGSIRTQLLEAGPTVSSLQVSSSLSTAIRAKPPLAPVLPGRARIAAAGDGGPAPIQREGCSIASSNASRSRFPSQKASPCSTHVRSGSTAWLSGSQMSYRSHGCLRTSKARSFSVSR